MSTEQDESQLKLLEIFHYVVSGMTVMVGCFPVIHLLIGIGLLQIPDFEPGEDTPDVRAAQAAEIPRILGWFFIVIPSLIILSFWTFAVVIFLGGRSLRRRHRHTFCMVVAGICCMFMPFGTALGVFTILVLMRPSVKQIFGVEVLAVDVADDPPDVVPG